MRLLAPILLVAAAPVTVHPPVRVHRAEPPADCADFGRVTPIAASPARRIAPLPLLGLRQPVAVSLAPTRRLLLETPSEHAAAPASYGGMLELRVPLSGRYRLATDGDAWIDLTRGGKVMPVAAEPTAPGCGSVRKLIDFDLEAGTYTVQLSDSVNRTLALVVAPAR